MIERLHLTTHAEAGALFSIIITSFLLTLITAGIYSFWGKVRIRRYLYTETEFMDERFAYHGTGKELFLGFAKCLLLLAPLGLLAFVLPEAFGVAVLYLGTLAFIPLVLYGARRYLLSRSSWRGIHFAFRGSLRTCYGHFLKGGLLMLVTFGLYYPYWKVRLKRYWIENTYYGSARFHYRGDGRELFKKYLRFVFYCLGAGIGAAALIGFGLPLISRLLAETQVMIIGLMVTFQLLFYALFFALYSWWNTAEQEYHWNKTAFEEIQFHCSMTWKELFTLRLKHGVALVFTLGLAFAWTKVDTMRFLFRHIALLDRPDVGGVAPTPTGPAVGAGGAALVDGLDIGIDNDIGLDIDLGHL